MINFNKFKGGGVWKLSSSSFLFSLRNKDGLAPFIANIKQGKELHAIHSSYGPIFGGGNICAFVTILIKLVNRTAILEAHINFPLVMSMAVNKQRIFLLVSTIS